MNGIRGKRESRSGDKLAGDGPPAAQTTMKSRLATRRTPAAPRGRPRSDPGLTKPEQPSLHERPGEKAVVQREKREKRPVDRDRRRARWRRPQGGRRGAVTSRERRPATPRRSPRRTTQKPARRPGHTQRRGHEGGYYRRYVRTGSSARRDHRHRRRVAVRRRARPFLAPRQPRLQRDARIADFDASPFPCTVAAPVPAVTIDDGDADRRVGSAHPAPDRASSARQAGRTRRSPPLLEGVAHRGASPRVRRGPTPGCG